jgi:hypothetical protein
MTSIQPNINISENIVDDNITLVVTPDNILYHIKLHHGWFINIIKKANLLKFYHDSKYRYTFFIPPFFDHYKLDILECYTMCKSYIVRNIFTTEILKQYEVLPTLSEQNPINIVISDNEIFINGFLLIKGNLLANKDKFSSVLHVLHNC